MNTVAILSVISIGGSLVVGGIFLIAGIVKALSPESFFDHLHKLRLLPQKLIVPIAISVTAVEIALGLALMLRLFPQWLFPVVLVLLPILTALTYWSTSTGRTEDCGCYGGLVKVNPIQSMGLNGLYASLIGFAWWYAVADVFTKTQQLIALLIAVAIAATISTIGHWYYTKYQKPILDLSPLRPNQRWQSEWLNGHGDSAMTGSKLVVFMNPDCSYCKKWLKPLNVVHKISDLPDILGAAVCSIDEAKSLIDAYKIQFPVVVLEPSTVEHLVKGYPTGVLLDNGVIQEKWVGIMPQKFVDSIRQRITVVKSAQPISEAATP